MRFDGLDLNLLVALDAVLRERSVATAAERLGLTSSATSHALARLRLHFGDELIVFGRGRVELTPRAAELQHPLREMLAQIRRLIAAPHFDSGSSTRTIRLTVSDYALAAGVAEALAAAQGVAPAMTFEMRYLDHPVEQLEQGNTDLIVLPRALVASTHPAQKLFEDEYVVVVAAASGLADGCDLEQYFAAAHIAPHFTASGNAGVASVVAPGFPRPRRVAIAAPSFTAIPGIVARSELVATLPRRLADHFARLHSLRVLPLPFGVPIIEEMIQRRSSSAGDAALDWLTAMLMSHFTPND